MCLARLQFEHIARFEVGACGRLLQGRGIHEPQGKAARTAAARTNATRPVAGRVNDSQGRRKTGCVYPAAPPVPHEHRPKPDRCRFMALGVLGLFFYGSLLPAQETKE